MYGLGTRSYNRSREAREFRKESEANLRRMAVEGFVPAVPVPAVSVGPMCTCRSFRFAHDPSAHHKLKSDMDWRTYEQRMEDAKRFQEWEPSIR